MKYYLFRVWAICLCYSLITYSCKEEEAPQPSCDGSLQVATSSVTNTDCGTTGGSIKVSASGGAGDYTFQLDQGDFQATTEFSKLAPGMYTVTVKDGNDCTAQVDAAVTGDLKLADILPIIETNCAISNCHDGSNSRPNFTQNSTIISNASSIKSRTTAKTMPPAGASVSLSDDEIDQIACWVDSGSPN